MKRIRRQKRVTLPKLLLRGFLIAGAVSAAFAFGLRKYIYYQIRNQSELQINDVKSELQRYINSIDANETLSDETKYDMISARLGMYTSYEIYLDQLIFSDPDQAVQVTSAYSPSGSAASALVDENDNVVADNKLGLRCVVKLGENDPYNGFYTFKPEMLNNSGADKLKNDIDELDSRIGMTGYIEFEISSIYYDKESRTFVPHEGKIKLMRAGSYRDLITNVNVEEEREINITLDDSRYEMIEKPNDNSTPRYGLVCLFGTPDDKYEKYSGDFHFDLKGDVRTVYTRDNAPPDGEGFYTMYRSCAVYIGGRQHELFFNFVIDTKDPQFTAYYRRWVTVFSLIVFAAAALLCWRKNVLNKAQYRFEDYQRELTDHLAHDIKTPLMAIGGYTENILDGKLTEDEQQRYLHSILDNVSFTDSIVNRTLLLNKLDSVKTASRQRIAAEGVLESVMRKYLPLLNEKNISYSSSGSTELNTDRENFETLIENLLSNAVKYTPDNGSVKAVLDKKSIVITNTVENTIETKDLKNPFVRGDASRSNTEGCGLGLSIADSAAEACGARLDISCANREFRAEIKL